MLITLFRRDRPELLLVLPILALLVWWPALVNGPSPPTGPHMPLYAPLVALMERWPWTATAFGMLLTMGIAPQLVFLANDTELFARRNHLPALMFPLLLALTPGGVRMDATLAATPLVLWALRRLWIPPSRKGVLATLFDTGALIGAAALIHLPCAFLLVVIWATNAVMRPFHWRDHVVPTVGFCLIFFLCWGITYVLAPELWHPLTSLRVSRTGARVDLAAFRPLAVAVLFFGPPAGLVFAQGYRRSVMRGKNLRAAALAFTLACAIIIAFGLVVSGAFPMALAAAPLSIFFSDPLLGSRRTWLAELGGVLLLALVFWAQWTTVLSSPA